MIVTRTELAKLLDVSVTTIGNYEKLPGFPIDSTTVSKKGVEKKYDLKLVIAWLIKRERESLASKTTENNEKDVLSAEKLKEEIVGLKIKNEKSIGDLLPRDAVEQLIVDLIQANNESLENIAPALVADLIGITDKGLILKKVQTRIDNSRNEFSRKMSANILSKINEYLNRIYDEDDNEQQEEAKKES